MSPPFLDHATAPIEHCDVSPFFLANLRCCAPNLKIFKMLRCFLFPSQKVVMCVLPLSGCYDTILRLRMMLCVLRHARVAAEATIAKKVDQQPPPHPDDAVHAIEEGAHHPPHQVVPPQRQNAATMCSPPPTRCTVTYHTPRHRKMQCVLPDDQLAAQARTAKKVDQEHLPPPGGDYVCDGPSVLIDRVRESAHHHVLHQQRFDLLPLHLPGLQCHGLPGGDDAVRD